MTETYNPPPPLGAFNIIGKSVRLFLANIQRLFLYAFIPLVAFGVLSLPLINNVTFDPTVGVVNLTEILTPGLLVLGLANIVVASLVHAMLVMMSYDAAVGDKSTFAQYLSHGLKNLLPIVGLSVAFLVMTYIGLALFVLPALYVFAVFVVYTQTILIDGAGWKGLHASAALTKGYRWPVLGTIILGGLIMLIPSVLLVIVTGMGGLSGIGNIPGILVSAALNAITYAFSAVFGTQIYLRLTELKRGGNSGELTDVFR